MPLVRPGGTVSASVICVPPPQALTEYRSELKDDPIISSHLVTLYDNLLEQNLIRVIEPFSRVQVPLARVNHPNPGYGGGIGWLVARPGYVGGLVSGGGVTRLAGGRVLHHEG